MSEHESSTRLILNRAEAGDRDALKELLTRLYDELRRIASAQLKGERLGHTLQPTALVHEAYLRLLGTEQQACDDRVHFLRIAGRVMREVLVDHARRRRARKRGGNVVRVDLVDSGPLAATPGAPHVDVLALHEALEELSRLDERKACVVELRFFSGLSIKETAEALGVSHKTVEADWYGSRAWLGRKLSGGSRE